MTTDSRDLQIAALRLSLREATRLLSYAAGRDATTNPDWAQQAMGRVSDMEEVLNLTGPAGDARPGPSDQNLMDG
ncbi:hypothetical protein [Streptomyces anulatus]|uniref:hypothetical protein n=1 Tax=Streptomyces anulatus TaxID=1892 RepID=UPI003868BC9B|nr:hypothetical protein OG882_05045 [Streptomyces anulatus]